MSEKRVRVHLFAALREAVGAEYIEVVLPEVCTVAQLKKIVAGEFPQLKPLMASAITACNRQVALEHEVVTSADELALFPPVTGGSGVFSSVRVQNEPIDLNEIQRALTSRFTGAICLFGGTVREVSEGEETTLTEALYYEAYSPMAEEKLAQVAQEIVQGWPAVNGVVLVHRTGLLEPGSLVIAVGCSSPRRADGIFEAARYAIDRIKEIVPIWKKEIGPLGSKWVEGKPSLTGGESHV